MRPSRRDFLASMLGAAALPAAACRKLRPVPGSIRGSSEGIGHRLRTPQALGEPARTVSVPIVIVGAGPSGLAAAWRLRLLGEERFVLLDLEEREGGTSTFGTDGVVSYPWGAHYVPVPRRDNTALVAVLREMGAIVGEDDQGRLLPAEEMVVRDPEERHFHDGEWRDGLYPGEGESAAEAAQHQAFLVEIGRLASLRDGSRRRAFDIPMERGSTDPELLLLDRIPFTEWMRSKGFTSPRLHWLVDYACRDDYGLLAEQTSAWAGLFYFVSRVGAASEEAAPLFAWTNGNGRLVEHFAGPLRDRIRTRSLVADIATFDDRAEVLAFDLERGDVVRYRAERIIAAIPKYLAPHVIRPYRDAKPAFASEFKYGPWMVANVHLSAHPRSQGAPLAWDNVIHDSPSLGYVVATHQAHVDEGPTILTYYYPYTDSDPKVGRQKLLSTDHASFVDLVLSDLVPAHQGLSGQVERVDVTRWGHAMVQPRPGFLWGGAREKASAQVGRIHMAHSDLSGMSLFEEALHHGVRAAEEVVLAMRPSAEGFPRWG